MFALEKSTGASATGIEPTQEKSNIFDGINWANEKRINFIVARDTGKKGKQKSNILLTGQRIKSCDIFIRLSTWNETKKIEKTDDEIAKQKDFMDQKKNPFDSFTIHSNQTDKHFFPFFSHFMPLFSFSLESQIVFEAIKQY